MSLQGHDTDQDPSSQSLNVNSDRLFFSFSSSSSSFSILHFSLLLNFYIELTMMFVEGMAGRAISSSLPLLLFLLLLSSSLASTSSLSSWTVQGPAPKESLHVITLWTRQNNIADQCDQLLYRIADPGNSISTSTSFLHLLPPPPPPPPSTSTSFHLYPLSTSSFYFHPSDNHCALLSVSYVTILWMMMHSDRELRSPPVLLLPLAISSSPPPPPSSSLPPLFLPPCSSSFHLFPFPFPFLL